MGVWVCVFVSPGTREPSSRTKQVSQFGLCVSVYGCMGVFFCESCHKGAFFQDEAGEGGCTSCLAGERKGAWQQWTGW
jgi:hypothetical protein